MVALLARLARVHTLFFVTPAYGLRRYGRLSGHGVGALGLDPSRLIVVETARRQDTLWAIEEALHSRAPAAVVGLIDKLDLRLSQRLQLAATDAGLPLFLLGDRRKFCNRAPQRRGGASTRCPPRAIASA